MEVSPIIIIKKRKGHGGHHGGAWKVAYADFVTAMMALFIVLWLMNASKPVQEAVGGYFRDPKGSTKNMGTNKTPSPAHESPKNDEMVKLKAQLEASIHKLDPQNKLAKQIEITITPEGLRIELMESAQGTFFESGSPAPTPALRSLLEVLSAELGKLPNKISIEGHTDSIVYAGGGAAYDNWDLSSGRANEARRLMWAKGVSPEQIAQVRGFADRQPRLPQHPEDPSNRRVTVIVQNEARDGSTIATPATIKLPNTAPAGAKSGAAATGPTPVRAGQ